MKLTNLQRQWQYSADHLGLSVETPFEMKLSKGKYLKVEVLVRGFGAPLGTIVVSDFATVAQDRDEIMDAGYTISSYAQPSEEEVESLEGLDEMLVEWGVTK